MSSYPQTKREEWKAALDALPSGGPIPAFFFAHGSPILIWPSTLPKPEGWMGTLSETHGPDSPLAHFLQDFGPVLLQKYKPRAIVVFSAHWEAERGIVEVTDFDDENPLLYDYYGFQEEFYRVKFKSRGDPSVSLEIVNALKEGGVPAHLLPKDRRGLDHGVFVPFKHMFGDTFTDVPIIEVSMNGQLSVEGNLAIGRALTKLREQGILILAGGLTVHSFQNLTAWSEKTASKTLLDLHTSLLDAVQGKGDWKLEDIVKHPGFKTAHPRSEHFIPIYVAAGAGESGEGRVLCGAYGAATFAFGL